MNSESRDSGATPLLVTISHAAQLLSVSKRHVWKLISKREITPRHIGKCTRILMAELVDFANGEKSGDAPSAELG